MDNGASAHNAPADGDQAEKTGAAGGGSAAGRRWLILVIGLIAMTAGCTFQYGLPYLPQSQKFK